MFDFFPTYLVVYINYERKLIVDELSNLSLRVKLDVWKRSEYVFGGRSEGAAEKGGVNCNNSTVSERLQKWWPQSSDSKCNGRRLNSTRVLSELRCLLD